jgi:hypothetical protein
MLTTLVDLHLAERGINRQQFISSLGVRNVERNLQRFENILQKGTTNRRWLKHLARLLKLNTQAIERSNRLTLLLQETRRQQREQDTPFKPYIEFILEGVSEPDSLMILRRQDWTFSVNAESRDFSAARKAYKQAFIAARGRCQQRRIVGFRYFWDSKDGMAFDIYGYAQEIIPRRAPPAKRFVSNRVLRAVGRPRLLVIHCGPPRHLAAATA